ncbi:hypothetical protein R6Q59_006627 [Mikania micrantha]|uniref:DUF1639 domain-containing protein n=1 Tax=Mikania micrantha TaxID=192012 RepID=A0A5N6PVS3_9ASTR|nr:hypothetical protein E3N88_03918 [Mikania micrantha]
MDRSNRLHNFNLPPGLTWGRQKLRRMNVNPVPATSHNNNDDEDDDVDDDESSDYNPSHESERSHRFRGERSNDDQRSRLGFKMNSVSKDVISEYEDQISEMNQLIAVDPTSEKKSTRPRRNLDKKIKFSIVLSRKEIEEDFIAMTGKKPRKPNKQPKSVKMALEALFPGSRLSGVHPDRYKVKETGKI